MKINNFQYRSQRIELFFTCRTNNLFSMTVSVKSGKAAKFDNKENPMSFKVIDGCRLASNKELQQNKLEIRKTDFKTAIKEAKKAIDENIVGNDKSIQCQVQVKGFCFYYGPFEKIESCIDKVCHFAENDSPVVELDDNHQYIIFCPICDHYFSGSEYLYGVFHDDKKALWFANMVMHYRHTHIAYWNKCWGYGGRYYRSGWFGDYDEEKAKVNERAKRQILRKCKDFLKENKFSPDILDKLQNTTDETRKVALKILGNV